MAQTINVTSIDMVTSSKQYVDCVIRVNKKAYAINQPSFISSYKSLKYDFGGFLFRFE